jgi:hypothetical protein
MLVVSINLKSDVDLFRFRLSGVVIDRVVLAHHT